MKKLLLILTFTAYCLLPTAYCFAQTPQSNVTITRAQGSEAALVLTTPDTQGNLLSLRVPDAARPGHFVQVPMFNTGGHQVSPWSLTLSGHYTSAIGSDGVRYLYIKPGGVTPAMGDFWGDTIAVQNWRANEQPGAFNLNSMNAAGETTFTLEANGDHVWGRVLAKQWDQRPMGDTRLGRTAPGVLATPGTLQAEALALGLDLTITRGKGRPAGACQNGSEYTQLDDGGRKFFCRAGQWMRLPLLRQ